MSWSRARAFEAWDNTRQTTILICLKRSFETFGGVPLQAVTDSMPGVVDRWECDQPLLNVRFVDFAAYHHFAVDIAPRGCPRYKGKKERSFWFAERNLLNGRKFASLEEFQEVLAWWTAERAMKRPHPLTARPLWEMLAEEQPYLQPLPARPYDTREVVIRVVDTYGYVQHHTVCREQEYVDRIAAGARDNGPSSPDGSTYSFPTTKRGEQFIRRTKLTAPEC